MKRNDRKYIKLVHFIKALKTDLEISKYLYNRSGNKQYKNEYRYNKYLLLYIRNRLGKFKELGNLIGVLNKTENSGTSMNIAKKERSIRTFYRIIGRQYKELVSEIYNAEDSLYNKYILLKEKNENNQRTESKGLERTL